MSTTPISRDVNVADAKELERQKSIALPSWELAMKLAHCLKQVGEANNHYDVWLLKGQITTYANAIQQLVHHI